MSGELPAVQREWWFTQLAAFLAAWMLLAPVMNERWLVHVVLQAVLLNAVLTTLRVNPGWGITRSAAIGLWLLSLVGSTVNFVPVPARWEQLARVAGTLSALPLLALLAVGILRFVYRSRRLTIDGIFATIVAYVLIAIVFSYLYLLMLLADPAAFSLPVATADRTPLLLHVDMLYYSLITQCSVGYGDLLPVSDVARMAAVIQAVIGQFYMAVVVAIFVGMYASRSRD